jgi:uncharacterized alkaline shock family protein YloU
VRQEPPSFSADVITSSVWDAIRDIPGVRDLHRNPLQALGERVHREWRGPVRLDHGDQGPVLEIQIEVDEGASVAVVGEAVALAGATYLSRTTGTPITRVEVVIADVGAAGGP